MSKREYHGRFESMEPPKKEGAEEFVDVSRSMWKVHRSMEKELAHYNKVLSRMYKKDIEGSDFLYTRSLYEQKKKLDTADMDETEKKEKLQHLNREIAHYDSERRALASLLSQEHSMRTQDTRARADQEMGRLRQKKAALAKTHNFSQAEQDEMWKEASFG